MTKRLCFSAAMVTFNPITCICTSNSPNNDPIKMSVFTDEQIAEIQNYLKGYNEKLYVIEADERIYVIVPSFYPTSTMCLLLRMDYSPKVFLRLVKEKSEMFVFSKHITSVPVRMSNRLQLQQEL